MAHKPVELSKRQISLRQHQVTEIARAFGFVGGISYRHVYGKCGGAQYCFGAEAADDLLLVYADAFDRDQDKDDFSLNAILAHECGHQRLIRDSNLKEVGRKLSGQVFEEVLASLIGSLLVKDAEDAEHLVGKAIVDLATLPISIDSVVRTIEQLRGLLKGIIR